jgi:hypothetical protein
MKQSRYKISSFKIFIVDSYFRNGRKIDGVWEYSVQEAWNEYREQFPDNIVDYAHFCNTLKRNTTQFRETSTLRRKPGSGRRKDKRTPENIGIVQHAMEEAPTTSIRHLAQQVEVSYGTCQAILKNDLTLYPYRLKCVQELYPDDFPIRAEYCH